MKNCDLGAATAHAGCPGRAAVTAPPKGRASHTGGFNSLEAHTADRMMKRRIDTTVLTRVAREAPAHRPALRSAVLTQWYRWGCRGQWVDGLVLYVGGVLLQE